MSKIRMTFKTPDAEDQIEDQIGSGTEQEKDDIRQQALIAIRKFVRCGEYVTVEFDIEQRTCTVIGA